MRNQTCFPSMVMQWNKKKPIFLFGHFLYGCALYIYYK
jgi:hypothetical protein